MDYYNDIFIFVYIYSRILISPSNLFLNEYFIYTLRFFVKHFLLLYYYRISFLDREKLFIIKISLTKSWYNRISQPRNKCNFHLYFKYFACVCVVINYYFLVYVSLRSRSYLADWRGETTVLFAIYRPAFANCFLMSHGHRRRVMLIYANR